MLSLVNLEFRCEEKNDVWTTLEPFKKFKTCLEQQIFGYNAPMQNCEDLDDSELRFFQELDDDVDIALMCGLLVDKGAFNVIIHGLEDDLGNCYENGDHAADEDGPTAYSVEIIVAYEHDDDDPDDENALHLIDLSVDYPGLLYFLQHKDEHDALARKQAYSDAVARDKSFLIKRYLQDIGELEPTVYRYYVSNS